MSDIALDERFNIINERPHVNEYLSAKYRKSFAFHTMSERLPVIVTQIIDHLARDKDEITEGFGAEAKDDPKVVAGKLSKLKYELQTDKNFSPITGDRQDVASWNQFIEELEKSDANSYFSAVWLYAECYLYRQIKAIFEESESLKDFDYFRKQKRNALLISFDAISIIAKNLKGFYQNKSSKSDDEIQDYFNKLVKLNLWGNRCDLSVSAGKEVKQTLDPFGSLASLESSVLIDQTADIWSCLSDAKSDKESIVDLVNDNAGYELFTDFCLVEYIIEMKLATKVRFNVKSIPWFISDVTNDDFHWTIETLQAHPDADLSDLGNRWKRLVDEGKIVLQTNDDFWTHGYEFCKMPTVQPKLYQQLAKSKLVIFKGDLNYRKLLGDFNFEVDCSFEQALKEFRPTNVCTIRTVKADLICGMQKAVVDELYEKNKEWNYTGEFGVIQFAKGL